MKHSDLITLLEKAIEIEEQLAIVKPLYKLREEIMNQLLAADMPKVVELATHMVILKDNFEKKNVAWKASSISRYELEISPK